MSASSFPDVAGTVTLEEDALVLDRSWARRFRSQVLRWRRGGHLRRIFSVISVLYMITIPILAAWYLALALVLDPWWASGPAQNLFFLAAGLLFLGIALDQSLRPRRIPLSSLRGGVETTGPRTLRLPPEAFGRLRALARFWTSPTIKFVATDDRDQVASLLEGRGVDVDHG